MKLLGKENGKENVLYLVVWASFFLLLGLRGVITGLLDGSGFEIRSLLESWLGLLPFLVLFLLHNYLAAPQLVYHKRTAVYVAASVLLFGLFVAYLAIGHGDPAAGGPPPEPGFAPDGYGPEGPRGPRGPEGGRHPMRPDVLEAVVALIMMGANLGLKFFFRGIRERESMERLEKENLRYQLEYLRYQINPHFFMNTLNNIHALVDLDPEKAKESIVELSKMMRHILYDSDKATIPLRDELDLLEHYISLMRLRFPDSVSIEYIRPASEEGAEVPPLSLASFVENAFKHGISYEKRSFVRINAALEGGKVIFRCVNSRPASSSVSGKGLGIENVRSRLQLLYGEDFTLHIEDSAEAYEVLLVLPAKTDKQL